MNDDFKEIYQLLLVFFKGNAKKAALWMTTPNPLFGNLVPTKLIQTGRGNKVLKVVKSRVSA